ncbi:MAG: RND transporter [Acidobacteria bacterium]|nr:MAG: RND transporter [Acidobacteriota bacterium]
MCVAAALLFSGCAVGPKYQRPSVEVPPAYKEVGNWKPAEPSEQKLGGNWWEIFQDSELNALEQQVNVSNQNLKIAEAQYTQVRALLRYNRADYFPTVAAAPSVTRGRVSSNRPPAQEQLLNSTVAQYEQALQLNEDRFRGGVGSEVEVEQAKTQLETTRAQATDIGVQRSQFEHAVAILIGKPPASFSLPPLPLRTPPPAIPAGVPSEILERRPDIASAERLVAAANARIGVAKAAYYPLLNLTAAGGFESGTITTLLQGPAGLWAVGGQAIQTLFDGGRRRAASDQAVAAYDQTVAAYRETVLTSFQQVEDSLAALRILENEAQTQHTAVVAAQKSLDLSVQRYNGGVTSYLEVTVAQSAALADEVTAVNILGRRMVAAVQLVQALGGGWDRSSLPQRPECCGKLVGQKQEQADSGSNSSR